jgi:hypothetical protein
MKSKLLILTLLVSGCATSEYTRDEHLQQYMDNYLQYQDTEDDKNLFEAHRAWKAYIRLNHNENKRNY